MPPALLSGEALDQLAVVDPEIQERLKTIPQSWQPKGNDPVDIIMQMRAGYDRLPITPPQPEVQESLSTYTTRDGASLRLCIYKPARPPVNPMVCYVHYHGGGSCIGSPELSAPFSRRVAQEHSCVVIAVQYRLAPEHRFPTQVEDSWDALQYIAAHASDFGAQLSAGFVIGGESAGAVIAAVLALQARDQRLSPPLTGSFLSTGSYFNPDAIPKPYQASYRSRKDPACLNSPMLSASVKAAFDSCVQGDYSSPLFKAALWPSGHRDLPRTCLQTCGMDINRDDGILYHHLLAQSGVTTKLDVYPGCPHCFWHLFPDVAQGKKWRRDTAEGLKWLFSAVD